MAQAIAEAIAREITELQLELKKRQWLAAARWRQRLKACLAAAGLTFTEWLVLDATWSLVSRTGDAVSPDDVSRDIEVDALTLWHALAALDHRALLRRSRSMSGKTWRVSVTRKGADLLRAVRPSLEGASAATH